MTLPASPPISVSDINVELGRSAGAAFSIQGAEERQLAGVPAGAISFSDFLGKSARSVTLIHTETNGTSAAGVDFGDEDANRWIVVVGFGGDTGIPHGAVCEIAGASATHVVSHSTGDGLGTAAAVSIWKRNVPTGASGDIEFTTTSVNDGFYVLRVVGYDLSTEIDSDDGSGVGIPPWSVNVPADGFLLASIINTFAGDIVWTGVTERSETSIAGYDASLAWDINMTADATHNLDVTASDTDGDTSAVFAVWAPL